jgi:hypothetical protein
MYLICELPKEKAILFSLLLYEGLLLVVQEEAEAPRQQVHKHAPFHAYVV